MRKYLWLLMAWAFASCWKYTNNNTGDPPPYTSQKVWGYKPVYATESAAKKISYLVSPQTAVSYGNINAYLEAKEMIDKRKLLE